MCNVINVQAYGYDTTLYPYKHKLFFCMSPKLVIGLQSYEIYTSEKQDSFIKMSHLINGNHISIEKQIVDPQGLTLNSYNSRIDSRTVCWTRNMYLWSESVIERSPDRIRDYQCTNQYNTTYFKEAKSCAPSQCHKVYKVASEFGDCSLVECAISTPAPMPMTSRGLEPLAGPMTLCDSKRSMSLAARE